MGKVRLLLADDHRLFRQGLAQLLRDEDDAIELVGEAEDGIEAVEKCTSLRPDVVLMDLSMPGGGGISAMQEIKRTRPLVPVLILTASEHSADLVNALKAGAAGYILKSADIEELIHAVKLARINQSVISPLMTAELLKEFRGGKHAPPQPPVGASLTAREKEVLALLRKGTSNKEIALILSVTEGTVKTHVHNILQKLALRNRTEAATFDTGSET